MFLQGIMYLFYFFVRDCSLSVVEMVTFSDSKDPEV